VYPKILIPLDGSELAECALPEVSKLAEGGFVREIILMSVVVFPSPVVGEGIDYQQFRRSRFDGYQEYLGRIGSRIASPGISVHAVVQEGNAAQTIINYVKQNAVDLIVIATHGYSGVKKLMFGSVALQVLHDADVPVLLIRSKSRKE
jgi:nucleotide-binding universal stress UspA family protein